MRSRLVVSSLLVIIVSALFGPPALRIYVLSRGGQESGRCYGGRGSRCHPSVQGRVHERASGCAWRRVSGDSFARSSSRSRAQRTRAWLRPRHQHPDTRRSQMMPNRSVCTAGSAMLTCGFSVSPEYVGMWEGPRADHCADHYFRTTRGNMEALATVRSSK